ncbi:MAG: hypothetical protein GEU75_15170 [Dehalococcoidia bacterium]|nr:hypothetical protein [Dehalococcoidia bacterium]
MSEQGPFDRILEPQGAVSRDKTARGILIGMGVLGALLLLLVLSPFDILGGGDGGGGVTPDGTQQPGSTAAGTNLRAPRAPEGLESLSRVFDLKKPDGSNGPYNLTVNLLQPASDGRNLALYTSDDGKWERLSNATLVNNGTAASGQVEDMPENVAVLRRTENATVISGALPAGAQADPEALSLLAIVSPVDYIPMPDGTVSGTPTTLPDEHGSVAPVVRASAQKDVDAANAILGSPGLQEAHINALVQLSLQPGYTGIEIDYQRLNPARKADFTSFITVLSDRLRQSGRTLTVTLPLPAKNGVSWDTGAYDWEEMGRRADVVKLMAEPDPSIYHQRMEEALNFLKPKLPLTKVVLVVTRQSYEKGTDGLRAMSLGEGLTLASTIEVRTTSAITPNSSVIIVGKNIFQDDGASGLRWDEEASAVAFSYPGRGGQRTVWLENSLSLAFRLDLARRLGLGGIAVGDISLNDQAPAFWAPLRTYAESGNVPLAQPNGVMLRPTWQIQAGGSEPGTKGNIVWKAPAQPGAYDVSLIVSDGVIRAMQKIVLDVRPAASGSPVPAGTPAVRP